MIPGITHLRHVPTWQQEQARAISDPAELLRLLNLDPALLPAARTATALFPLRVPRSYLARMDKGDPHDPLLRQVLPLGLEAESTPGFVVDPVGDRNAMPIPGVLHKYQGRVLLLATGACGVHCRYCFRREFPYTEARLTKENWRRALAYLADDEGVSEIILSGGDPLALSNRRLKTMIDDLQTIDHLRRLRIHSRQPIVLPSRVDEELLALLRTCRFKRVLVLHANHPREIDDTVAGVARRLRDAGMVLFNQSVLLKGVNDSADVLTTLSETLFGIGVIPYYLHCLDPVRGTAHFRVEQHQAKAIMEEIRNRLPGYLVPRLVQEEPGRFAKTLLG